MSNTDSATLADAAALTVKSAPADLEAMLKDDCKTKVNVRPVVV